MKASFFLALLAVNEMENPKFVKVSVPIQDKDLEDLQCSVSEKGGSTESNTDCGRCYNPEFLPHFYQVLQKYFCYAM